MPVLKKPLAKTVGTTPEEQTNNIIVGRKVSVHCKSTSLNSALIYLTSGLEKDVNNDPVPPGAGEYTFEIVPGGIYAVPFEHVGEVWIAGLGGNADVTITQYG